MYKNILAFPGSVARLVDATGMYRTVSIALGFLTVVGILYGFIGLVEYSGLEQLLAVTVAIGVAMVVNLLCSKLWRVSVNMESAFITALIIHFLLIPAQWGDFVGNFILAVVVVLATVSKYVFAWHKQHIVNPAAIGVVLVALAYELFPIPGYFEASWWVGQSVFFIPLLLAGSLVVMKVRKWTPVIAFLGVGFLVYLYEEWKFYGEIPAPEAFWLSGPSLFLAFFMLTEPFTMPPTKRLQFGYGALVGFISQTTLFLSFGIKMVPELALVIGNLLFYPSTLRRKLILPLATVREVAKETFEFAFTKPGTMRFRAGQYLEWMLPHDLPDSRGIRRYFTIASSPVDPLLRITLRIGETVSSYKQQLKKMKPGDTIIASQLAGDFLLPRDIKRKVAMVAGGIGVTPFLSHIDYMQTKSVPKHNTVLFYCNNTAAEIAYRDRLQAVSNIIPLQVVHVLAKEKTPPYEHGYLTKEMIIKYVPDYLERAWYLSGPPGMVNAYSKLLLDLGVKRRHIKKDFFPGLA